MEIQDHFFECGGIEGEKDDETASEPFTKDKIAVHFQRAVSGEGTLNCPYLVSGDECTKIESRYKQSNRSILKELRSRTYRCLYAHLNTTKDK